MEKKDKDLWGRSRGVEKILFTSLERLSVSLIRR